MILAMWLAAAHAAPTPQSCPTLEDEGYDRNGYEVELAMGDATKATFAAASDAARTQAQDRLIKRLSQGMTPIERMELARNVTYIAVKPAALGGRRSMVCGYAVVETQWLDRFQQQRKDLAESVRRSARGIQQNLKGRPVYVEAAQTASGGPACAIGRTLNSLLKKELVNGASLAENPRGAWRVRLEADANSPSGVVVSTLLWAPDAVATTPVAGGGFTVNPVLLVADVKAQLECARRPNSANGYWGLDQQGRRLGRDGLVVDAVPSADLEYLDDGQEFELEVTVSAPAQVQVYSLMANGRGWLVYPTDEPGGHRLGPNQRWRLPLEADAIVPAQTEHLLITAVPADAAFTRTRNWKAWCEAPGKMQPVMLPRDAAMRMVRFSVSPRDGQPKTPAGTQTVQVCGSTARVPYP